MTIRNLEQANQILASYVSPAAQLRLRDLKLERVVALMALIGNPQERLRVVHVAGTSGKTSTAYYVAALLTAAGYQVGLTVSPHIDSVTERVQINGRPLPETVFCQELGNFLDSIESAAERPSYFELLYAFAVWMFARNGSDYAVVETGLGGLLDATNTITAPDKVCVITDIGFDHMNILGKTLPKIAVQKIGIVHHKNHVFMYEQAPEIMQVVKQWTDEHQAPLHLLNEHQEQQASQDDLINIADYQKHNWLLAYNVYRYLQQRDNLSSLTRQALQKTQALQIPARMDVRQAAGKTLVMDGAHNLQKMTAFMQSFQHLYPGIKPALLIGLKDDKEYQSIVPLLAPLVSRVITSAFSTAQDLPIRSVDPEMLAEAFRGAGVEQVHNIPGQRAAYEALVTGPEAVCIIAGSFYLLSQIRNNEQLV